MCRLRSPPAYLVEELAELLDLGLLFVLQLDAGLLEDVLGGEDRGVDPDRKSDRVAGPRRHLGVPAVGCHPDRGEEGLLDEVVDDDALDAVSVVSRMSRIRSWVMGRGVWIPWRANAMAVASTAPIQIGR